MTAPTPTPASKAGRKIGRVVTSYGHWRMIDRWLSDDRLLQPHVSWIFVNDKPSDPLPAAMRERVERFGIVIQPTVNMGRCCARNLGVQRLEAEWIDIIDGDDLPSPVDADFDAEAGGAGFMYFDVAHHREIEGRIEPERNDNWTPPALNQLFYELLGNWDPRPIAVMWRRATLLELGGFDGRADYVEDMNLVIRARLAGVPFARTTRRKGSYQRDTTGRAVPPIVAVANHCMASAAYCRRTPVRRVPTRAHCRDEIQPACRHGCRWRRRISTA